MKPDLEDLREALLSAGDKTRHSLDNHELGVLSRVFDVDENGKTTFVVWECRLPSGDGGERNYEILRLPWDSLLQSENALKEISIAFDCEIDKDQTTDDEKPAHYRLRPQKPDPSRPLHQFKMRLEAEHDYVAEATMDGVPLDVFLEQPDLASRLKKLPFYKDLWLGLKGIKAGLMEIFVVLLMLAAPILGWLFYTGQI